MKTKKIVILAFIFVCVLSINNNVFAKTYGALNCRNGRWSLDNQCTMGDSNYKSDEADLIEFDLDNDNKVILKRDNDRLSVNENNQLTNSGDSTSKYNSKTFKYSKIQEYYEIKGSLPENMVVYASWTGRKKNDGTVTYEYYPSTLIPVSKGNNSKKYIDGYYASTSNLPNATVTSCEDYNVYINRIKTLASSNSDYSNYKNELKNACEKWKTANYLSSDCYTKCSNIEEDLAAILDSKKDDDIVETNSCGLGKNMIAWLIRILKIIRYIVPIIVVVLSTLEYIGAVSAANDEALKKVGARFSKRLFIMILIFLLPSLLQFIFDVFNIQGLDGSNPYCLKFDK